MDYEGIKAKARLILKYRQNSLSEAENRELQEWLSESKENQEVLNKISADAFLEQRREEEAMFNSRNGFSRFAREHRFKSKYRRILWYWSAAACVLMILGVGVAVFKTSDRASSFTGDRLLSAHGYSQARLILADGKTFEFSGDRFDSLRLDGAKFVASGDRIEYTAIPGQAKVEYNTLEVPRKGEFFVRLSDGTKVWLNSETTLRYPVTFTGEKREVFVQGEAFFEVQKDTLHPFVVKMEKRGNVLVTGTSFNVRSYPDEQGAEVTLVTGKVNLTNQEQQTLSLIPGEQGCIAADACQMEKYEVNVSLYTSWKEGRFVFKEQPLQDIMKTISRWYDVEVVFADPKVKEATFSGNLQRYSDFGKILQMLEAIKIARFEVKENHICINEYKKAD